MDQVDADPARGARGDGPLDGDRHVLDPGGAHQAIGIGDRQDQREGGQAAQQGRAAIGRRGQHQARPQDGPVQRAGLQQVLGLLLGGVEGGGAAGGDAGGGDVHEPSHAGPVAGLRQAGHALDMHGVEVVARAVLQGPGAIDHGVHTLQHRGPVLDRGAAQVGDPPVDGREAQARGGDVAPDADHRVILGQQPRGHVRTDQAIGPEHQDPHGSSSPCQRFRGIRCRDRRGALATNVR